jgi:cob(I)alamin adenosyltransferase
VKIYTRAGDDGRTVIYGGKRMWKDEEVFEVLGTLDELSSILGYCRAITIGEVGDVLRSVQLAIYRAGVEVQALESGAEPRHRISRGDVEELERVIDKYWSLVGGSMKFIIPTGSEDAAMLHYARTVCRRLERLLVRYLRSRGMPESWLIPYFNRLGDLLYTLARYVNRRRGVGEEAVEL